MVPVNDSLKTKRSLLTAQERNERERKRMQEMNLALLTLERCLPAGFKCFCMSKTKTILCAIEYIFQLEQYLSQKGDLGFRGKLTTK